MRRLVRVVASCASLAVVLSMATALQAATLEATVSFADGAELFDNPGCGYAGGGWANLTPDMSTAGQNLCSDRANCTKLWSMHKFAKGYVYGDTYTVQTNHYAHITNFVGGADIPLTEKALLSVSNSFLKCRRNGGTCIPRFAYTWDGWGGAEPDDFETIIGHIRQLGRVISQFRDVVPAVECGIIGAYGEMHTSRYTAKEYQNRVVGAWLENLPSDMALLVRSPPVWMKYLDTTTPAFIGGGMDAMDQTLRSRMGFYNDGYLGTDYDYGTWGGGGGTTSWSRSEGRTFLKGQAVPYGGEFAGITSSYFDSNVHLLNPSRFNIVAEWYDTHLSYLRTIRAYDMTIVQKLTNTLFSASAWAFDGMPDLSEYEGVDLRKFCEDHMGYRYVVRGVNFTGGPNSAVLSVEVENTGFGQLLFDDELEVLLADAQGWVSAVRCDGSLRGLRGGEKTTLALGFAYPEGIALGDCSVYLRVRVPLFDESGTGTPRRAVRFANAGCYNAGAKANYICTVRLEDGVDIVPDDWWFAYREQSGATLGGHWLDRTEEAGMPVDAFALDRGVPKGCAGEVEVQMRVGMLSEIPHPEGGKASFVFLSDNGRPVPYGYCSEGWVRLGGVEVSEDDEVVLKIWVSGGAVSYALNGVALSDASGRRKFPAKGSVRTLSRLVFVGADLAGDFTGEFTTAPPPPLVIHLR